MKIRKILFVEVAMIHLSNTSTIYCSLVALTLSLLPVSGEEAKLHADIVVYGDASGGVTAAVQGKKMGKSVILVSQYGQ